MNRTRMVLLDQEELHLIFYALRERCQLVKEEEQVLLRAKESTFEEKHDRFHVPACLFEKSVKELAEFHDSWRSLRIGYEGLISRIEEELV